MRFKTFFAASLLIAPLVAAEGRDHRPLRERRVAAFFSGSLYHEGTQILFEIRQVRPPDRGTCPFAGECVTLWFYMIKSYGFGHTAADTTAVNTFYLPPGVFSLEKNTDRVRFFLDLADIPDILVGYRVGGGALEERGIELFEDSAIDLECVFEPLRAGERDAVRGRYDGDPGEWSEIRKTRMRRVCALDGDLLGMPVNGFRGALSSRVNATYFEEFQTILRSSPDVPLPEVDFPIPFYKRNGGPEEP